MPYRIVDEGDLLYITVRGDLSNADLRDLAREITALEASLSVVTNRIVDLHGATGLYLDFAGMMDVANQRTDLVLPNRIKTAMIAPEPIIYGFARMFQMLNLNPLITVAIFPDEGSARQWLAAPGHAPPAMQWAPSSTRGA